MCNSSSTSSSKSSASTPVPPSHFLCPLTLELMSDPLLSVHGHSFERKAIIEWLHRGNGTCPLTRKPLPMNKLIANAKLKVQIHQWKRRNGMLLGASSSHHSLASSTCTSTIADQESGSFSLGSESNHSTNSLRKTAMHTAYSFDADKYDVNEQTQCMESLGLIVPGQMPPTVQGPGPNAQFVIVQPSGNGTDAPRRQRRLGAIRNMFSRSTAR